MNKQRDTNLENIRALVVTYHPVKFQIDWMLSYNPEMEFQDGSHGAHGTIFKSLGGALPLLSFKLIS